MSNDNILKRIWYVFNGIYVVTLVYSVFVNYTQGDMNGVYVDIAWRMILRLLRVHSYNRYTTLSISDHLFHQTSAFPNLRSLFP